jgi:hypothetical protein
MKQRITACDAMMHGGEKMQATSRMSSPAAPDCNPYLVSSQNIVIGRGIITQLFTSMLAKV